MKWFRFLAFFCISIGLEGFSSHVREGQFLRSIVYKHITCVILLNIIWIHTFNNCLDYR